MRERWSYRLNAALLSEIVGTTGKVVTIELDEDLAEGAQDHLAETGYGGVTVLCRDVALGTGRRPVRRDRRQ